MISSKPICQQTTDSYVFKYPQFSDAADEQGKVFWTWTEPSVEKDVHDLKTNMTEAEYHGVITTLKLFTLYELMAGSEYWSGRFMEMFPRPEFQKMGAAFSYFELGVHAPFYNRINEVLGLDTDEFYTSYTDDETLKSRMSFIDEAINDDDDLYSLGTFSMIEGAVLYSSFAFLRHFVSEGKNKIININSGVAFSVRDEHLHSKSGAEAFKVLLRESGRDVDEIKNKLERAANTIREHEHRICEMVFEKGKISGITEQQMKNFVDSRIDVCMEQLGFSKMFKPTYNPIAKWFYRGINSGSLHDFFAKQGNEYNRDYDEKRFVW